MADFVELECCVRVHIKLCRCSRANIETIMGDQTPINLCCALFICRHYVVHRQYWRNRINRYIKFKSEMVPKFYHLLSDRLREMVGDFCTGIFFLFIRELKLNKLNEGLLQSILSTQKKKLKFNCRRYFFSDSVSYLWFRSIFCYNYVRCL